MGNMLGGRSVDHTLSSGKRYAWVELRRGRFDFVSDWGDLLLCG
jgi:hypothetical protein